MNSNLSKKKLQDQEEETTMMIVPLAPLSITLLTPIHHGTGIPVELFQILKDYAVKVLHSICQKIWKTQQWPQNLKRSVFIPIPKKAMPKNVQTTSQLHSSHKLAK